MEGKIKYKKYGRIEYSKKIKCEWIIIKKNKKVMKLNLKKFEIENYKKCEFELLKINDGRYEGEKILGR